MNNLLFSYWGEFQAHTLSALHTVMATKDYTPGLDQHFAKCNNGISYLYHMYHRLEKRVHYGLSIHDPLVLPQFPAKV